MKIDGFGVVQNPAEGLNVKSPGRTTRRPFTVEQLIALFSHPSFRDRHFLHPHYYWLMPMSMLTGMRLNDCVNCDFLLRLVDSVPIIQCADMGEDQRGKNSNATRRVTVHRELVRLGLLRWVEQQRVGGHDQLFPELKPGRDGHGQSASNAGDACGGEGEGCGAWKGRAGEPASEY